MRRRFRCPGAFGDSVPNRLNCLPALQGRFFIYCYYLLLLLMEVIALQYCAGFCQNEFEAVFREPTSSPPLESRPSVVPEPGFEFPASDGKFLIGLFCHPMATYMDHRGSPRHRFFSVFLPQKGSFPKCQDLFLSAFRLQEALGIGKCIAIERRKQGAFITLVARNGGSSGVALLGC